MGELAFIYAQYCDNVYTIYRGKYLAGMIIKNALDEYVAYMSELKTASQLREIADKLEELNGPEFVHQ